MTATPRCNRLQRSIPERMLPVQRDWRAHIPRDFKSAGVIGAGSDWSTTRRRARSCSDGTMTPTRHPERASAVASRATSLVKSTIQCVSDFNRLREALG